MCVCVCVSDAPTDKTISASTSVELPAVPGHAPGSSGKLSPASSLDNPQAPQNRDSAPGPPDASRKLFPPQSSVVTGETESAESLLSVQSDCSEGSGSLLSVKSYCSEGSGPLLSVRRKRSVGAESLPSVRRKHSIGAESLLSVRRKHSLGAESLFSVYRNRSPKVISLRTASSKSSVLSRNSVRPCRQMNLEE